MFRFHLLSACALVAVSVFAVASPAKADMAAANTQQVTFKQPDLLSFGVGYEDFDKDLTHQKSANFRGEYRWGVSLLPLLLPDIRSWDNYVQLHPWAGVETNTLGSLWAGGGFNTDFYIGKHGIVTWQEGVGFYYAGDMRTLDSNVEFRSQIEGGWVFNDLSRLTAQVSHESNAGLTKHNPGEETVGLYYHIPISEVFGGINGYPR